jgi:hypothetical protein
MQMCSMQKINIELLISIFFSMCNHMDVKSFTTPTNLNYSNTKSRVFGQPLTYLAAWFWGDIKRSFKSSTLLGG